MLRIGLAGSSIVGATLMVALLGCPLKDVESPYPPGATATGRTGDPVAPFSLSGRQIKVNS